MATTKAPGTRTTLQVHLGAEGTVVGELIFLRQGKREFSQFQYASAWLADARRFEISPDLPLVAGHHNRKAPTGADSVFHFAIADTAPDAWGRRVIDRAHAELAAFRDAFEHDQAEAARNLVGRRG